MFAAITVVTLLGFLIIPSDLRQLSGVQELKIQQKQDHFNTVNSNTWEMRYIANGDNYEPGGPLFIVVGGMHPLNSYDSESLVHDMAKEMKGYVFYTEHRYYGHSRPTSDMSLFNLQYLSVDQAIGDLKNFIEVQRNSIENAKDSKVILSGCGYGATIAIWFHKKHPEIASGVWASSAHLKAVLDFSVNKEDTTNAVLNVGGGKCHDTIKTAFESLERKAVEGNFNELERTFGLCKSPDAKDQLDVSYFMFMVSNMISNVAKKGELDSACSLINNLAAFDPVEALGSLFKQQFRESASSCIDISSGRFINLYSTTVWDAIKSVSPLGYSRPYLYQMCNEFGWFLSSSSPQQMFGSRFSTQLHEQLCKIIFSQRFDLGFMQRNVDDTNRKHGGFDYKEKNVFFTKGEVDPWRSIGVSHEYRAESPVVVLKEKAQCSDLKAISDSDSEQLKETKERIKESVRNLLMPASNQTKSYSKGA